MYRLLFELPSIRVNNFKGAVEKIMNHWKKYEELNSNKKIIYAFYFNYETNYKGDYDFTIGGHNDFVLLPRLAQKKYKIFISNRDKLKETWEEIWRLEEYEKINRAYDMDFEKYYPDGNIEIYISVL